MVSPKRKIYIIVVIAVIMSVCILMFGLLPFAGKVIRSSRALTGQMALLDLINVRIDEVKSFRDDSSSLRNSLDRIESVFVEANSPVAFLAHLERIAMLSQLSIKTYPFESEVKKDDMWSSIGLNVRLGGTVQNTLRFLDALEQSKWLFEILELSLQKVPDENPYYREFPELQKGDAYLSLTLKAYSGEVNTL